MIPYSEHDTLGTGIMLQMTYEHLRSKADGHSARFYMWLVY